MGTYRTEQVGSEDNLRALVLFFHHFGPRDGTLLLNLHQAPLPTESKDNVSLCS